MIVRGRTSADIIDGIRFVKLEKVRDWKKAQKREKDLHHIKLVEDYLGVVSRY